MAAKSKRAPKARVTARVMVRVSPEAKANLVRYATQLTGARGKFVGMAEALEEVLLALPKNAA